MRSYLHGPAQTWSFLFLKSKVTTRKDPLSIAKCSDVCPLLSVVDVFAPHMKLLRRVLMFAQYDAIL
jgi:hypothetical protein